MTGNKHPGPNDSRDPLFVELERRLDSGRVKRAVVVLIYGAMYGMALFILACLSDFAGAGDWIYKYGGSW